MRTTTLCVLAGSLLPFGSCTDDAPSRPDVLLVCIDTLRPDHLGCYGYERRETSPALDALAREATVFADASAAACWTKPSVPSFLTGTYPAQHGVYEGSTEDGAGRTSHVLPEGALTLAEVFAAHGYRTGAFVKNAQLRRGQGLEQGFDTYVDAAGDAREVRWRALDWLAAGDDGRPFFLYLHVLDVHWPWPVPDEYAARFAPAESVERFRGRESKALLAAVNDGEVAFGEQDREDLAALYDGAIRFVDDQLGLLFAELERRDLWAATVVGVVSDHGEELGEAGRVGHGHGLRETLLRVPFLLRVPGRAPARVETAVSLVDLFPTLLAAAGVRAPESAGRDRLADPGAVAPIVSEHKAPDRYQLAARRGTEKCLREVRPHGPRELSPAEALARGRFEVELARAADGRLVATSIEPADDEDEGDPAELKGVLDALGAGSITLAGVRLAVAPDLELRRPSDLPDLEPVPGALVKARLEPTGDGRFACTRLKLYPPGTEPDFELRGAVERAGERALAIAGVEVALTEETELDVDTSRTRLTREQVLAFLRGDDRGLRVSSSALTLADGEERAVESAPSAELDRALEAWAARASRSSLFRSTDERAVSEAELEDLRAIGYAD